MAARAPRGGEELVRWDEPTALSSRALKDRMDLREASLPGSDFHPQEDDPSCAVTVSATSVAMAIWTNNRGRANIQKVLPLRPSKRLLAMKCFVLLTMKMKRDQRITISEKKIFTRAFSRKFLPFRLKSIKWASFFQPSPFQTHDESLL
jgi:hypothetical protein